MTIKIPLIYEDYETIEITFEKNKKNILEQYKILRNKYLKVKDIISAHICGNSLFNENLSAKIEKIEEENNETNNKLF